MKTLLITCLFIIVSPFALANGNPATEAVKDYVQKRGEFVYQKAAVFHSSSELFLDDNLKCFSSYSYRAEVGFCRQSGQSENHYSTFLIIVREAFPGKDDGPLTIDVVETSRIYL